jgi:hypothetical protein
MKVDHFASLLRAVACLEHTSYEARGAIYDQVQSELMERLQAAEPPCSEADIDWELLEFRAAVRRVEFGDMDEQDRKAQQAITERAQYLASRREAGPAAADVPPAPVPTVVDLAVLTQRRSVFGRVAGRAVLAAVLVVFGLAGYAYDAGQIDASLLDRIAPVAWLLPGSGSPEPAETASYYEQAVGGAPWRELTGSARWRSRLEGASVGPRRAALTLDLRVPERGLSMSMAIRRDAGEDTAITHLFEFMFSSPQGAPLDSISAVKSIIMKQEDGSSSRTLAGLSIKVAPGLFLFGLSAEKDDAQRNAQALRALSRFDIPITFADGASAIISVSKGASGERAFAQALADWAADQRPAADQRGGELLSQGALWMRSGSLDRR